MVDLGLALCGCCEVGVVGLLQSGRLVRGEPPGTAWLLSRDFGEEWGGGGFGL